MTETSAPAQTRSHSDLVPLRAFVGALVLLAVGGLALLWPDDQIVARFHLPWYGLALLFYLAETCLVHLHFRRGAHSFSMSEVPLVLGLFFATPREVLLSQLLGCGLALAVQRRQNPVKVIFNLANFTLTSAIAIVVLRALLPEHAHIGLHSWGAAAVAAVSGTFLGCINVSAAIFLSERRADVGRLLYAFGMFFASALTNVSLGLIAATIVDFRPAAAWLLVIPTATVFLAYRAYLREREKHEILEFLYSANRILTQNPELEAALAALLNEARRMFRTETAEAIIAPPDGGRLLRIRLDGHGEPRLMEAVTDPVVLAWWERMTTANGPLVLQYAAKRPRKQRFLARLFHDSADTSPSLEHEYLEHERVRNAIVAPLRGETRPIGMLMVGDRPGEGASFGGQDVRLFEALANHVSVALENGRLEQSLAQLRELEQKLTQLAFHDPLTGLANRALFSERLSQVLAKAKAEGRTCAVLFIDLDDFKTVNDTLGHDAGDELLCAVAERITGCLRPSDQPARLGGDEFAVIIEDALSTQAAERIAARITEQLRAPISVHGCELHIRASIGIATSQGVQTADELLRNADLAMYMAKADGKGRYRWFRPSMRTAVVSRHQLKSDLERAAERGEFQVHYQPIVDLRTGRPVAAEALVRWVHPERGLLFPETFISEAESSGIINEIGRLVLRHACAHVGGWQQHVERKPGEPPFAVAVNLSPAQFAQPDLVAQIDEAVEAAGIDPNSLILEITETMMLQGSDRVLRTLDLLSGFGVRLAMDDFGTGYASLASLRKLPIDIIKIAKTFTDDITGNEEKSPFVRAMIELGEALGLVTLAEGVETAQQARELERLGCRLGQGYHFARPVPSAGIELLLQRYAEQQAGLAKVIAFPA
ncbi:MAG: EAL domain-containing protein [Acidothermus cellulolyticus]|nr:EAL domain-containing protein [Acidothermus cellulolyticus]